MSIVSVLISLVVAFAVTAGLGFVIIPWLRKLHFGQTILDIGPVWHKKKQGTPNMGGLMFIIGIIVAFIVGALTLHFSGGSLESAYSNCSPGGDHSAGGGSVPGPRQRDCRLYRRFYQNQAEAQRGPVC